MLLKYKINNLGFSIIELIISASIIAIISVLVVANFRGSTQTSTLGNEADRVASIIREAHINSLIGNTVNGARPEGGFGISFDLSANKSYIRYADQGPAPDYVYSVGDTLMQTIGMLDNNVYIVSLSGGNTLDINFVPPDGDIYFDGILDSSPATITLGYENTSYTKTIAIDPDTGQININ